MVNDDFSYINKTSIHGLMNCRAMILEDAPLMFSKSKNNKKNVVVCRDLLSHQKEKDYNKINYMYLDDYPEGYENISNLTEVISEITPELIDCCPKKKFKNIHDAVSKFKDKITVRLLVPDMVQDLIKFINEWAIDERCGDKYGWQLHVGIDKHIISQYINDLVFHCNTQFYVFYDGNEIVGYSCIELSREPYDKPIVYIVRKCRNGGKYNNLTRYIDWFTFKEIESLHADASKPLLVNWGASSGKLLWYKKHEWPIYSLKEKWFCTVKNSSDYPIY